VFHHPHPLALYTDKWLRLKLAAEGKLDIRKRQLIAMKMVECMFVRMVELIH
jgi:hypothetical protein